MSRRAISRSLRGFTEALAQTLISENSAHQRGLLQELDPRVKLIGMFGLILAVALSRRIEVIAALFALALLLALASRLSLIALAKRVWLVAFGFTFMIAAPALFLTPGQPLMRLPLVSLTVTVQGASSALLLLTRVESAVTFSALLVLTTPWMHLLKALRTLMVPTEAVMLLAMTHRYVVLLCETANAMFEARQSRMVGRLSRGEQRRLMVNTGGVLLGKTYEMGNQVFLAMQSRGFRGEIRLLNQFRLSWRDGLAMSGFAVAIVAAVIAGR